MTFPQLQVAVTFSYCGWMSAFMIFPRGRPPVRGANNSRARHEINCRMSQLKHTNPSFDVEVAIPAPLHQTFSYRSTQEVEIGQRVRVNFSGREVIGVPLIAKHQRTRPAGVSKSNPSSTCSLLKHRSIHRLSNSANGPLNTISTPLVRC